MGTGNPRSRKGRTARRKKKPQVRSRGGWKVAALGLATVLAIGVMWYMSLPSVARVETFKRAGNARAILSIVKKCVAEDKRADIMQANANAVPARKNY